MRKFLFLLFSFILISGHAQTRNEFWCRLNITHPVDQKWSIGLDMHHRRQANYRDNDKNIFRYQLGNYMRLTVYYQLPKKWTIFVSPIGYFANEDILTKDGELKLTNELRTSLSVIKAFDIGPVKNRNRFQYDIRFPEFDKVNHYVQTRYRMHNSFTIPVVHFSEKTGLNYFISNEVFIKKQKSDVGFDQDRIYNALQLKISKSDILTGYQWVLQKGNTSLFHRNQLYLTFNLVI